MISTTARLEAAAGMQSTTRPSTGVSASAGPFSIGDIGAEKGQS